MSKFIFFISILSASFSYAGAPIFVDDAPTSFEAEEDKEFVVDLSLLAEDPDGDELSWSISPGSTLPNWLVLNSGFSIDTIAGTGEKGSENGVGSEASFNSPNDLAVDSLGNIYVTESSSHQIRKISADGNVSVFAGTIDSGYKDGQASSAQFYYPSGVATDSAGNLYVADRANNLVRKISTDGIVTTLAGTGEEGYLDGEAIHAKFSNLIDITVDDAGTVYVVDGRRIRTVSVQGKVSTLAGSVESGYLDGVGETAQFGYIEGITLDKKGSLLVTDGNNRRIRKVDIRTGNVSTLAGNGQFDDDDGELLDASFSYPMGIVTRIDDTTLVGSNRRLRKLSVNGEVTTLVGEGDWSPYEPDLTNMRFDQLTVDQYGRFYAADSEFNKIRKILLGSDLSGFPTKEAVGTHDFCLSVSDGESSAERCFSINVKEVNDAPVFVSGIPPSSVLQDQFYSYQIKAVDEEEDIIDFKVVGYPDWLSVTDLGNGEASLSGYPSYDDVGLTETILISVSDGTAQTFFTPFNITVVNVNDPPTITGVSQSVVNVGEYYAFRPIVEDKDIEDPLTFYVSGKPSWMSLDASTGEISGIPTEEDIGEYTIEISVSDVLELVSLEPFVLKVESTAATDSGKGVVTPASTGDGSSSSQTGSGGSTGFAFYILLMLIVFNRYRQAKLT